MRQSVALINALKRALRANGVTYAEVARGLKMSEANVKRMFSEKRFYLGVFDEICQLIGLEISDLTKQVEQESQNLKELSKEQEKELASDPKLLLIAFLVINRATFHDIVRHYQLSEPEVIGYLVKLDKLTLIELLPGNRVKLLIAPNFAWRHTGPIQQFFTEYLQKDFLDDEFDQPDEVLYFLSGLTTPATRKLLLTKLKQLANEFNQHNNSDTKFSFNERHVTSMIVAMRSWQPKTFEAYTRSV